MSRRMSFRPQLRSLKTIIGACLAALASIGLIAACASAADAQTDGTLVATAPETPVDVKSLIAQLGDEAFSVRESATNQLIRQGVSAKPDLLDAIEAPDAEVRHRARHVLEIIVAAERKRQLQSFRADIDGTHQVTLPGWPAFKKAVGDDPIARDLFVKIEEAEPDLMEAFDKGPKEAAETLKQKSAVVAAELRARAGVQGARPVSVSLGSVLAMLFVGGEPGVSLNDELTDRLMVLPQNREFRSAILPQTSAWRQPCQRILGRWVARDVSEKYLPVSLAYAVEYNLKEGIVPATRTLKQPATVPVVQTNQQQPGNPPATRAIQQQTSAFGKFWSLALIGKFGEKDQMALIEPFLKDTQTFVEYDSNNQPMQVQVCDVALVAAIQLAGQDPKDFGFVRFQANDRVPLNAQMVAFRNKDERAAAFKKWETWQEGQKQAARQKVQPKTSIE